MDLDNSNSFARIALAYLEYLTKPLLSKEVQSILKEPSQRKALSKALEDVYSRTEKRSIELIPDEQLSSAIISLPLFSLPNIKVAMGDFFNRPSDSTLHNVLHAQLCNDYPMIEGERIDVAVRTFMRVLQEEFLFFSSAFRQLSDSLALRDMKTDLSELVEIIKVNYDDRSTSASTYEKIEMDDLKQYTIEDILHDVYLASPDATIPDGVPTGFRDLDRLLGGLRPANLVILGGVPGSGTQSFLLSILLNAAIRFRKRVAYFSLADPKSEVARSLLSMETGIPLDRMRMGFHSSHERSILENSKEFLSEAELSIVDSSPTSINTIRQILLTIITKESLDLIFINSLDLITNTHSHDSYAEGILSTVQALKFLARELNIPIVLATHTNLLATQRLGRRPFLSDLPASGEITRYVDTVIFTHRFSHDDPLKQNIAEIIVAHNRNGAVGAIELICRPSTGRFEETFTARIDFRDEDGELD